MELKDLTPEQLNELKNAFDSAILSLIKEAQDELLFIKTEAETLRKQERELWEKQRLAVYPESSAIMEQRMVLDKKIVELQNKILNQENIVFCLENGGMISAVTDKKGKEHTQIPDFRSVNTNQIYFDLETILTDKKPVYVPNIDEDNFRRRGYVFDAIRLDKDSYILAIKKHSEEEHTDYVLVTLDQLVLISDYYYTKAKAILLKEARDKNKRSEEYWDKLPEEKRERFLNQKNLYHSLPVKVKKEITQENYEALDWKEKEKLYKFYKRYGSKKIVSKLGDTQMWTSFHSMYERFIDPTAVPPKKGYGNEIVFAYWYAFREMMKYKINDLEIQRDDLSEMRKIALETSYGESNTSDVLKQEFGILVKRQNGDKINPMEIDQIKNAFASVQNIFGNLKNIAAKQNIKISHTGVRYCFASKAIGMYVPKMGTIAVSDKYGDMQFKMTLAHETGHFIDNYIGELNKKSYASNNYESTAGQIAFVFRDNMNKPKSQHTNYVNSTQECFARAMEQFYGIEAFGDDAGIAFSYVPLDKPRPFFVADDFIGKDAYYNKLKPLIIQFFTENEDIFKYTVDVNETNEPVAIGTENENTKNITEAIEVLTVLMELSSEEQKEDLQSEIDFLKSSRNSGSDEDNAAWEKYAWTDVPEEKEQPNNVFEQGGETKLLAPNGKPSNLTPDQYKLVRTPEFKQWFGDWENNIENSSKVVDENGEPLVVYHGSKSEQEFNVFDSNKGNPTSQGGHYFSNDKNFAQKFGNNLRAFFLRIENPLRDGFDGSGAVMSPSPYRDGGIFTKRNTDRYAEKGTKEIIVFEPNQIKIADGTNTTFDNNNPDIRFQNGGKIESPEVELAKKVQKILQERGITKGFSVSNTDFGTSVYFYVSSDNINEPLKIRISDHSVQNISRIFNEEHFTANSDAIFIADMIEQRMYPDRYKDVEVNRYYVDKESKETVDNNTLTHDNKSYYKKIKFFEKPETILNNLLYKDAINVKKEFVRTSGKGKDLYNISFELKLPVEEKIRYKKVRINLFEQGGEINTNTDVKTELIKRIPFLKDYNIFNHPRDNKRLEAQRVVFNENVKVMMGNDVLNFPQYNVSSEIIYYPHVIGENTFYNFIIKNSFHAMQPKELDDLTFRVFVMAQKQLEKKLSYNKEIMLKTGDGIPKPELDKIINEMNGVLFEIEQFTEKHAINLFKNGGEITNNKELYQEWKELVNMSATELEKFKNTPEGKKAGLTKTKAKQLGISSGQESSEWILKMKNTDVKNWTPEMWKWAAKQVAFIKRMSGVKGDLFNENNEKTPKHTSLLIWGHNPVKTKKLKKGGETKKTPEFTAESDFYFEYVPLEEIEKYKEFDRETQIRFDKSELDNLTKIIAEKGITHPITLQVYGNYGIIPEGNHRIAAAKRLGIKNIPVKVEVRTKPFKGTIYEQKVVKLPRKKDINELKVWYPEIKLLNIDNSAAYYGFTKTN